MAQITGTSNEKVFPIKAWLGLHQNPDGDTKLKYGEASDMRNFRITRDGNLQRRPGTLAVAEFGGSGGDTLTWDGNTEGLHFEESLGLHKISDATPTLEEAINGTLVSQSVDGTQTFPLSEFASDFGLGIWQAVVVFVVPESAVGVDIEGMVISQSGIYSALPDGASFTLTIPGYTGFGGGEPAPVNGMWTGYVKGEEVFLAACGGKIYRLTEGDSGRFLADKIGDMDTENEVHFFGFNDIAYMLNGKEYKQWDGEVFADVHGYRPLVNIAIAPDNTSREELEQINKLCGERRAWISPDGTGKTFTLPEKNIQSIDYVMDLATGENIAASAYSYDLSAGTVTFASAPAKAINSYEIGWTMAETFRHEVLGMRWSEFYSGSTDATVFLYGDGSNEAIYSDVDYDGTPRADYFPDMNEVKVGDSNTPITGMIRQYSTLVCFKSNSTWAIQHGTVTRADGIVIPAFYVTPTNRSIGNAAPGQVRLVLNAPHTLFGNDVYEWRNTSSYSSNLSKDERQAKRISDRVYAALGDYDFSKCKCWDDNDHQEYYICYNRKALILNYAADAWYAYDNFDVSCMVNYHGELYIGTSDGRINHFGYEHLNDNGEAIDAYWESGSMSFGQDYMRKYAAMLWIGIEPESRAEVNVTVMTDKKSSYAEKVVFSSLSTFDQANFAEWSFRTNRKPFMTRLKIKAKKFVFYKLVFSTNSPDTSVTLLAADIRVRFQGYAK